MVQRFVRSSTGLLVPAPSRSQVARGPAIITRRNFVAGAGAAAIMSPAPAWAVTPKLIASTPVPGSGGGGGSSAATPQDTTGVNLIIAFWASNSTFVALVSDNKGNTYSANFGGANNGNWQCGAYYVTSPTVGTNHIWSVGGAGTNSQAIIMAFSGATPPTPFDQATTTSTATIGTLTFQPAAITPTYPFNLAVSFIPLMTVGITALIDGGFIALPTLPFTAGGSGQYGMAAAYLLQGTAAPIHPTWTLSANANFGGVAADGTFQMSANPFPVGAPLVQSFPP